MVRDVGFEGDKTPFMVIDVRTKVAKFSVECIDPGKEAFFHFRHRSNVAVFQRGHRGGMAFLYLSKSFVQLVKKRIKNRVQFLIKLWSKRIQFVIDHKGRAIARVRSRVAKAILLAALVAGWRSSFLGEKSSSIVDGAIGMSRGWAVAHPCTLGN